MQLQLVYGGLPEERKKIGFDVNGQLFMWTLKVTEYKIQHRKF